MGTSLARVSRTLAPAIFTITCAPDCCDDDADAANVARIVASHSTAPTASPTASQRPCPAQMNSARPDTNRLPGDSCDTPNVVAMLSRKARAPPERIMSIASE